MNILYIGYKKSKIKDFLEITENLSYIDGSEKITLEMIKKINPELIVLHGCHTILSEDIIKSYPKKIVNCHGALLPWNRGAHPNLWSVIENTPKGGTIHMIDENIDMGEVIAQKEIDLEDNETLSSSYWKIRDLLEDMFITNWNNIKNNTWVSLSIDWSVGTLHYRKDLKKVENLLINGWDTKICELKNMIKYE
jgi:methionyl-tRNA formyltransferase